MTRQTISKNPANAVSRRMLLVGIGATAASVALPGKPVFNPEIAIPEIELLAGTPLMRAFMEMEAEINRQRSLILQAYDAYSISYDADTQKLRFTAHHNIYQAGAGAPSNGGANGKGEDRS